MFLKCNAQLIIYTLTRTPFACSRHWFLVWLKSNMMFRIFHARPNQAVVCLLGDVCALALCLVLCVNVAIAAVQPEGLTSFVSIATI